MKPEELKDKTKPELLELAERVGLDLSKRLTRAQVLSALTLHYTAKAASRSSSRAAAAPPTAKPTPAAAGRQARIESPPGSVRPSVAPPSRAPAMPSEIPALYHEDRLVLMARDPYWVHAYWEVTEGTLEKARQFFGSRWDSAQRVLRVYDVTGVRFDGNNAVSWYDVELTPFASNWYVNVPAPNRAYCADVGVRGPDGTFYLLARSNAVRMPRVGMSEVVDEKWRGRDEDFKRIYALSGGHKIGLGSLELRELMERRFKEELSSGFVSSLASLGMKREVQRGFRFLIDAELIVYGATEPDATVTVQGKRVALRPDGTFTLRFALPDGRQVIPAVAMSADGVEERTITLSVARATEAKQPRILAQV